MWGKHCAGVGVLIYVLLGMSFVRQLHPLHKGRAAPMSPWGTGPEVIRKGEADLQGCTSPSSHV